MWPEWETEGTAAEVLWACATDKMKKLQFGWLRVF